jgi:phosphoglucomutase
MITASHNPSKYNGYKVYFEDGAQIVDPVATGIIEEVNKIKLEDIKVIDENNELFNMVPEYVFEKYINVLNGLVLNRDIIKEMNPNLKIVYTPLNGSGNKPVQTILKTIGFDNVYVVKEQENPDGNFPTCPSPNPENPAVYELALKLAEKENADVILATDPDADRLGIYSFDKVSNTYKSFTGNMSALLIAEYRLSILKERGLIPDNGIIVKSLVSSNLADAIANEYNLKLKDVLTGFKYIGEQIKLYEQNRDYTYLFGFEESYGCLFGTYARDKDGVAAVMALAEAAAYYKSKGLTLCDQMENIYKKYGYYLEETVSIEKEGLAGIAEIQKIMQNIRENPFKSISDYEVLSIKDYKLKTDINLISGETKETDLPTANVLYYIIENDAWIAVRPSGTEPKIKFYVGVKESSKEEAENKFNKIKEFLLENIK